MADLLSYFFRFVHLLKLVNQIARSLFLVSFKHFNKIAINGWFTFFRALSSGLKWLNDSTSSLTTIQLSASLLLEHECIDAVTVGTAILRKGDTDRTTHAAQWGTSQVICANLLGHQPLFLLLKIYSRYRVFIYSHCLSQWLHFNKLNFIAPDGPRNA